ncbi:MAG: zinc ribbon-containing protein [Gammaproteobacteria bacterium]|nr:zinc ribbon-containing protein [Gammaproteobacteria bacterium]
MASVTDKTAGIEKAKTSAPPPQARLKNDDIHSLLPGPEQQKAELAAYERLRQEFTNRLAEVRESINRETLKQIADRATQALKATGSYTAEIMEKAGRTLQKDIASASIRLGEQWHKFSDKTADVFEVWHDRGNVFLGHAAKAVGEWLEDVGEKGEHPTYHTGDMAMGGTFECRACGERIQLNVAGHLPPCPSCYKTKFRRL